MVPRATGLPCANIRVQGRRHADTLPQAVVLPTPLVRERDIHARTSGGAVPLLPLWSSPRRHFAPKSQST